MPIQRQIDELKEDVKIMKMVNIMVWASIIALLLSGCGGGGQSAKNEPDPIVQPEPVYELPKYLSYTLDDGTGVYSGLGLRVDNLAVFYPVSLSTSQYSVSARFEILDRDDSFMAVEVSLYNYVTTVLSHRKVYELSRNGDVWSGGGLELMGSDWVTDHDGQIVGDWENRSSAGQLGEVVTYLHYDGERVSGYNSAGCNISGTVSDHTVELQLLDCDMAGDYSGLLNAKDGRLKGAVNSADHGFVINYHVRLGG